jgi:hypothetical protein
VPFEDVGLDKPFGGAGMLEIANPSLEKLDTRTILFTDSDGDDRSDTVTVGSS